MQNSLVCSGWYAGGMRGEASDEFRAGRRSRVIDFRGRTLDLCEVGDLPADAPVELRKAVKRANQHRLGVQLKFTGLALVILLVLFFAARWVGWLRAMHPAQWILYPIWGFFGGLLGGREAAKGAGKRAVEECLKGEVCPSCGYSLVGLPREGDGCVVCAECGGVWRVGG